MPETAAPDQVPGQPRGPLDPAADAVAAVDSRTLIEADLLVEDVSIDGMCGVY